MGVKVQLRGRACFTGFILSQVGPGGFGIRNTAADAHSYMTTTYGKGKSASSRIVRGNPGGFRHFVTHHAEGNQKRR